MRRPCHPPAAAALETLPPPPSPRRRYPELLGISGVPRATSLPAYPRPNCPHPPCARRSALHRDPAWVPAGNGSLTPPDRQNDRSPPRASLAELCSSYRLSFVTAQHVLRTQGRIYGRLIPREWQSANHDPRPSSAAPSREAEGEPPPTTDDRTDYPPLVGEIR